MPRNASSATMPSTTRRLLPGAGAALAAGMVDARGALLSVCGCVAVAMIGQACEKGDAGVAGD
jgi:hypothetical protein